MGAKPGQGCSLCGSMMYSEILAAKPSTYFDNTTQSTIGYMTAKGADGYTEAGTWMTYNDIQSVKAITKWEMEQGLAGMFVYSADMDTKDYQMLNAIADTLAKPPAPGPTPGPGPAPGPGPGPGPTPAGTPTCQAAGNSACGLACSSTCRGFPPGFPAITCLDQVECTNPPKWAKNSVCTC